MGLIVNVEFYCVGIKENRLEVLYRLTPWAEYVPQIQEGIIKSAFKVFNKMEDVTVKQNDDNLIISRVTDFPYLTLENFKKGERELIRRWEDKGE